MKRLLILLVILQSIVIVVGGIYVYNAFIKSQKDETNKEVVDIRKKLELPNYTKEDTIQQKQKNLDTLPKKVKTDTTQSKISKVELSLDTPTNLSQLPQPPQVSETPQVQKEEKKSNPTDIKVDVNIGNIDIPKIGSEIGGGFSVSGALAVQQAYEDMHDLNKTIQLANEILKNNPNDQVAQKYKKLAELEIMANDALNRGDRQSALNYFYQMQAIDPNNKWARRGIMKIMSGN